MKHILFVFILFSFSLSVFAQTQNMDFESGDFSNWNTDVGYRTSPTDIDWNGAPNAEQSLHIRMMNPTVPPEDEYGLLCDPSLQFPTVYPGGNFSARIGDHQGGYIASRISRTFTVTPEESFLLYHYAVLLEEPGHSIESQPKFVVNIKDASGELVECGQFEAFAGENAAAQGFTLCGYDRAYRCDFPITECPNSPISIGLSGIQPFPVQILPWTSAGADLTPYIGQQITIEFLALDCMHGAHGGSAYVEASLAPLEIQVEGLCNATGNTVTLTAPIGFSSYQWSTGETTPSITVTNASYGDEFSVSLISNTGCDTEASVTLGPVSAATIDPLPDVEICEGGNIIVTPTGTNVGDFYFVELDETGDSALYSPTTTTTYTVVARDENGCAGESTTFTINVIPSTEPPFPTASFTMENVISDEGYPCNTIQFTNTSGYCKSDLTYLWDFGDGTTSTEQNPLHSYPLSNFTETYFITLTVTSQSDGLSDSYSTEYSTSSIIPRFSTTMDCSAITVYNLTIVCGTPFEDYSNFTYTWDFGDDSAPVTTDEEMAEYTHNYTSSGMFTITLTMTDNNSNYEGTTTRIVGIRAGSEASFTYFADCLDVTFQDQSNSCNPIQSYLWDFRDGSTSTEENPTHSYTTEGPHTVTLTVNDGVTTFTYTEDITLDTNTPTPNFTYETSCDVVRFTERSSSCVPLTYAWDFGDGFTSTEENPVHLFTFGQTYTVTLTIDNGIQTYTTTEDVAVYNDYDYQEPLNLQACATSTENNNSATFNLNSQSTYILDESANAVYPPIVSYHASLEDAERNANIIYNTYTNEQNPQVLYARVESNQGCFQTFPFTLSVESIPTVNALDDVLLCFVGEQRISYDLLQLNAHAFEGLNQEDIGLTYHSSENEANANINAIQSVDLLAGEDTVVFIRAENVNAPECYSTSSVMLRMDNENTDDQDRCMPFYSNTMTPNGDRANDTFYIENIETFPNNHLIIYNRWGHKVYETNGYLNDWNGTWNGKPLPMGTYYFHITLNDNANRTHSGYISILR